MDTADHLVRYAAPVLAQAPTDAQRSAIGPHAARITGALLQHSAGRHGVVAMPAAEHVEPVVVVPDRGACGRTVRRRPRPNPRRRSCAESRSLIAEDEDRSEPSRAGQPIEARGDRGSAGAAKAAQHSGEKAEQCANCRDTQRVPFRLSEGLRRRAGRRRRGAAMPGKEQVEILGRPASRRSMPPAAGRKGRHRRRMRGRCTSRSPAAAPAKRRHPLWCCGRCGRARSCSCCDRHAAPTCARCARASRPAAAASWSALQPRQHRFRPGARTSSASSPRNRSRRRRDFFDKPVRSTAEQENANATRRRDYRPAICLRSRVCPGADRRTAQCLHGGFQKYCKGTIPGGGRIIACLNKSSDKLTPACKKVLADAQKK